MIAINAPDTGARDERGPDLIYVGGYQQESSVEATRQILARMKPIKAPCHAGRESRCDGWNETAATASAPAVQVEAGGGSAPAEAAQLRPTEGSEVPHGRA